MGQAIHRSTQTMFHGATRVGFVVGGAGVFGGFAYGGLGLEGGHTLLILILRPSGANPSRTCSSLTNARLPLRFSASRALRTTSRQGPRSFRYVEE